ncbi:MAG: dTMP kinase [Rickettsiaceae bacterium]|nr:dTMP kinase [Rickettsiaceae bacterium]
MSKNFDKQPDLEKFPRFITFEGMDGSGKTTQSKKLYQYLISKGIQTIWTREIGGTEIAEQIRDIVVSNELITKTELLLILAARCENVEKVIRPALNSGAIIICDRFIDSTAAYQSETSEDMNRILDLHKILFDNLMPDKTFFLKLDPEDALARANERGDINKYEMKDMQFRKKVAENYDVLISKYPNRFVKLDASLTQEEIFESILSNTNQ